MAVIQSRLLVRWKTRRPPIDAQSSPSVGEPRCLYGYCGTWGGGGFGQTYRVAKPTAASWAIFGRMPWGVSCVSRVGWPHAASPSVNCANPP